MKKKGTREMAMDTIEENLQLLEHHKVEETF